MAVNNFVIISAEIKVRMIGRIGNGVLVGHNHIFEPQCIILCKCILDSHSEITAETVLQIGRKTLKHNIIVTCFFNLPRSKTEASSAVKSPSALIYRGVIFLAVESKFCVTDSVCPSADNKSLITVVGVCIILRIVKTEHNIRQNTVFIRHIKRLYACPESLQFYIRSAFICNFIKVDFGSVIKCAEI